MKDAEFWAHNYCSVNLGGLSFKNGQKHRQHSPALPTLLSSSSSQPLTAQICVVCADNEKQHPNTSSLYPSLPYAYCILQD